LQKEALSLNSQLNEFIDLNRGLTGELQAAQSNIASLQSVREQLENAQRKAKEEIASLSQSNDELKDRLQDALDEEKSLAAELHKEQQAKDQLNVKLQEISDVCQERQFSLEKAESTIKSTQDEIKLLIVKLQQLAGENKSLSVELQRLQTVKLPLCGCYYSMLTISSFYFNRRTLVSAI